MKTFFLVALIIPALAAYSRAGESETAAFSADASFASALSDLKAALKVPGDDPAIEGESQSGGETAGKLQMDVGIVLPVVPGVDEPVRAP